MANSTFNILTTENLIKKDSYEDSIDPQFPKWLLVVVFLIGIFGNAVSLLVFCQKNMRKNSTFIYLAFLCVVDLLVVLFGLGDLIIISYFSIAIRNQSIIICRLHTFLTYSFTHLSSFILASVSIERAIATNYINYARKYCQPKTAYKILLINVLIALAINFHSLLFLGHEPTMDNPEIANQTKTEQLSNQSNTFFFCSTKHDTYYDTFLSVFFEWLDLIFYAILPFIILAICSFFIIRKLLQSNKRVNRPSSKPVNLQTATCSLINNTGNNIKKKPKKLKTPKIITPKTFGKTNTRLYKTLNLTYTLISINILFFILVSPLTIARIIEQQIKDSIDKHKLLFNIIYLLAYSNHSLNFIFYGLSSPPYREAFLSLFNLKKGSRY